MTLRRKGELNEWVEIDLYVACNDVGFNYDPLESMSPEDVEQIKKEREEKLARKRPIGFQAAWPDEQPEPRKKPVRRAPVKRTRKR